MFDLPGREGVEEVVISREVVEGRRVRSTSTPIALIARWKAAPWRTDSTETKRTLPYNIRPRHELFIPSLLLRGASKSASTDLHDQME